MYPTTTNNKQRVCVVNGYVRMIDAMHKGPIFNSGVVVVLVNMSAALGCGKRVQAINNLSSHYHSQERVSESEREIKNRTLQRVVCSYLPNPVTVCVAPTPTHHIPIQ